MRIVDVGALGKLGSQAIKHRLAMQIVAESLTDEQEHIAALNLLDQLRWNLHGRKHGHSGCLEQAS